MAEKIRRPVLFGDQGPVYVVSLSAVLAAQVECTGQVMRSGHAVCCVAE